MGKIQIKCKECGEIFTQRKISQKFCSSDCRVKHNNDKANSLRWLTRPFDNAMRTNYKVVIEIIGNKPEVMESRDFLRGKGYNFNVDHGYYTIANKKEIAIYNIVLIEKPHNNYLIKKYQ